MSESIETKPEPRAISERSTEVRELRPGIEARRDRYNQLVARVRILTLCLVLALVGVSGQTALIAWKWSTWEVRSFIFSTDRVGEVRYLGSASEVSNRDPRVIRGVLQDWLFRARTVTSDPAIQRQFIAEAQALTTGAARQILQLELRRDRNPFVMARERSVSVEVVSMLPIGEGVDQWDLVWLERHTMPAVECSRKKIEIYFRIECLRTLYLEASALSASIYAGERYVSAAFTIPCSAWIRGPG